ncbi:hypothetical protein [Mycobacterium sp. 852002-51057_SCH5723018]|uniref:hypothetical protein n=1 Tax=Mycobacterium sp. 852002-51057_SCH5723018 TaxID=1834094 RepID=UPI00080173E4|nr:hypothetical protein [Mycobacterium sp. 852002-51057_SCH5723018]OBG22814.1 hypothetical protein A5764_12180 [Mycobacterium sp. 852002-51057_SCH5723018]
MKTINVATVAKSAALAVVAGALGAVALGVAGPANATSVTMYGDPVAAAQTWQPQQYDDCVLMASADVVGQLTGELPSEEAVIAKAHTTPSVAHPGPIYTKPTGHEDPNSGGTSMEDVPTLLARYEVSAVLIDNDDASAKGMTAGMAGLERALGGGHKVIVSVNGELIWQQPVEAKDQNGNPVSDHAVVVTGVDTANHIVHLNDSGTSEGRDEQIPMGLFVRAWDTSNDLMVVTRQAGNRI